MARIDGLWQQCKPRIVQPITDAEIEEMLAVLGPLEQVELPSGSVRFALIDTNGVDRRKVAYTWEPSLICLVRVYLGFLNSVTIPSFHVYGAPVFFKPSLAETCAAIKTYLPDWHKAGARYFWVDNTNLTSANVIGDHHWVRLVVFGDEEKDVEDRNWVADNKAFSQVEKKKWDQAHKRVGQKWTRRSQ